MNARSDKANSVMFTYWGRRGALTLFTHQVGKAAMTIPDLEPTISVSRQNEEFDTYQEFGSTLFPVDTFGSNIGSIANLWTVPTFRKKLRERLRAENTKLVIELMPHIWSPLIMSVLRQEGVQYATIIHDAQRHPGDYRSIVNNWMKRCMTMADHVITLSDHVAKQVLDSEPDAEKKLVRLFHPNLTSEHAIKLELPTPDEVFRLLFLGRIMKYKGLPLLVEAVESLVKNGHSIKLGIFGEGNLEVSPKRLQALGAEVNNHWLSQSDITDVLQRYQAMVLSHLEASQSGVLALAHGANMPVVATPVGGITKQIQHGKNGLLANDVTPEALANEIEKLMTQPALYKSIHAQISAEQEARSPRKFVEECLRQIHAKQSG